MRFLIKRLLLLIIFIASGYGIFCYLPYSIYINALIYTLLIIMNWLSFDIGNLIGFSQGAGWTRNRLDKAIKNTFGMDPEDLVKFKREN